jgi:hypothetical protein
MKWGWETFPEYLDALEQIPHAVDLGTQVPHGAVRAYVMGERGAKNEPATRADIAAMAEIVRAGIEAGALGFSTSRTIVHRAIDGEPVPGTFAAEDELFGIGRVLRELGRGLFELAPAGVMGEDLAAPAKEVAWMRKLSAEIGRPVSFALSQHDVDKDQFRAILEHCGEANAAGAQLAPQVGSRPTMLLIGHQTFHPFTYRPTYQSLAELPLAERVAKLRDPEIKRRILAEKSVMPDPRYRGRRRDDRERTRQGLPARRSAQLRARARGEHRGRGRAHRSRSVRGALRPMLELDGRQLLMLAILSYSDGDLEALREMLEHPASAFGLGDGGAHCGAICDASMTTFLLTHWARDRSRGPKLPVEWVVRKMTRDTAWLYGLRDRGVVAPGNEGRPERDRLGPARARTARARARPARGRASARAARARLRGHARVRDRHDARRRAYRRAAGPGDPRAAIIELGERQRIGRKVGARLDRHGGEVARGAGQLARRPARDRECAAHGRRARHQHARGEPAHAHVAARARVEVVAHEQRVERAATEAVDVVVARAEVPDLPALDPRGEAEPVEHAE